MEEKKYHIEKSKVVGDEAYNTDSYPMGRSLEQVMKHCAEIDKHLDDPNYGHLVDDLIARLERKVAQWR